MSAGSLSNGHLAANSSTVSHESNWPREAAFFFFNQLSSPKGRGIVQIVGHTSCVSIRPEGQLFYRFVSVSAVLGQNDVNRFV